MFNFLDPKLSPKVICNAPATDHYEVENLISNDYSAKVRGFIAYPSIKPPVELEFEFICPINIYYIQLITTVGTQKCSGIEILAQSNSMPFIAICKLVYDKRGVIFCNSRKSCSSLPPPTYDESNFQLAFFKSNMFRTFTNANKIKIIIFRTEKSVPCIASTEVWGTTSKQCSEITTKTIERIMHKSDLVEPRTSPQTLTENRTTPQETKHEELFSIPEDFKDDLTFEIMAIPMTLPSGKTIDRSTLDKHIKGEASFGRKPCDPFTGIKFTDTLKPILNVPLKSRIDMFLLQNSQKPETYNMKRTVGRAKLKSNRSLLLKENIKRMKLDLIDSDTVSLDQAQNSSGVLESSEHKVCCKLCASERLLYVIPCDHHYCRECLPKVCAVLKCSVCDTSFLRIQVTRFHY